MFHNLYEVSSTRMPFLHRKIEPNSYFKAKVKFEYLSLSLLTTWSLINFLKILYFFCMYSVPVKIQSFIVRVLVIDLCMSTVVSSCICSHILSEMQSTKKKAEWEVEQPGFNPVSMWVEDTDIARSGFTHKATTLAQIACLVISFSSSVNPVAVSICLILF